MVASLSWDRNHKLEMTELFRYPWTTYLQNKAYIWGVIFPPCSSLCILKSLLLYNLICSCFLWLLWNPAVTILRDVSMDHVTAFAAGAKVCCHRLLKSQHSEDVFSCVTHKALVSSHEPIVRPAHLPEQVQEESVIYARLCSLLLASPYFPPSFLY